MKRAISGKHKWFIYGAIHSAGAPIIESITNEPLVIDPLLPALVMLEGEYTPVQIRTTGARAGKYEIKKGAKENLSNNFPLFRLTDFYLLKAEMEVRLGRNGDQWVNPIRQRPVCQPIMGQHYPTSTMSVDESFGSKDTDVRIRYAMENGKNRGGKKELRTAAAALSPSPNGLPMPTQIF